MEREQVTPGDEDQLGARNAPGEGLGRRDRDDPVGGARHDDGRDADAPEGAL